MSAAGTSAEKSMASKGVTYKDGKVSIKTDRAPKSRDEQIASAQARVSAGVAKVSSRPDAFYAGAAKAESPGRGFQRTKKLD